jgi:hypothetical protein
MSLEAVVDRVGQILTWEQQMADPALALSGPGASGTAGAAPTASAGAADAGAGSSSSFAQALADAQGTSSASGGVAATPNASGYVNPLADASVKAERIDQGVDYAGTGTLGALGPGVVTQVVHSGSGWEGGGYVEYKLTSGPYAGRYVYYAEGVTPTVSVGQTLQPGQAVATIIPGSSSGIEIGFAAGQGEESYANAYGGGYSEGQLTAAGQAFSNLIASLGAPAGLTESRQAVGHFP